MSSELLKSLEVFGSTASSHSASIIAIHGLDGHAVDSWTSTNGKMWLRDFLPDVIDKARIMTYGYNTDTRGSNQLSVANTNSMALTMLARISSRRQRTKVI